MTIDVRAARPDDLPAITAIYNHYVAESHATFDLEPVTLDNRREWFAHYAASGPHRLLVAVRDGRVAGYTMSSTLRPKPGYLTSVETTVYVDAGSLGLGIGRALYAALFRELAGEDLHKAFAGIALPNSASIALHRSFGFTELGVFREAGRKFGRFWDVQWYERPLPYDGAGTPGS